MYQLPVPQKLLDLTKTEKINLLDHLFEPCPTLATLLVPLLDQSYISFGHFIDASRKRLLGFLDEQQAMGSISPDIAKIISAHPRLGPSKDALSAHSSAEQRSLAGTQEEAQKLARLNSQYEETFPGLRYVVFVNGRTRDVIMADMQRRIDRNDISLERYEAFNAMCDIAIDRAVKLGAKL